MAYVHIPDQLRKELDSNGEKCIFLGYCEDSKGYRLYNPSTENFVIIRDVQFIEEEAWDGSFAKTINVKSCLYQDENEEDVAENNTSSVALPPPRQGQQGTPQAGVRTPLRRNESASPSTPHGADMSAYSSISTPNERGTRFRNLNEIYEKKIANEGMNSLFSLYFHVDVPIHFEEAIKDKKWIEAMDEEIKSIEKNNTWELVDLPEGKEVIRIKWVYNNKRNAKGKIERHKARLDVKG